MQFAGNETQVKRKASPDREKHLLLLDLSSISLLRSTGSSLCLLYEALGSSWQI